jgi:hypothetical protein
MPLSTYLECAKHVNKLSFTNCMCECGKCRLHDTFDMPARAVDPSASLFTVARAEPTACTMPVNFAYAIAQGPQDMAWCSAIVCYLLLVVPAK